MNIRNPRRAGFTRADLAVLLAAAVVLAGLVLPALVQARQAAGKTACVNNLKQIGLGLHGFHDAFQYFPTEQGNKPYPYRDTGFYTQLLPYVEQKDADPKKPTPIKLFLCPDRRKPTAPYRDFVYVSVGGSILGNPNGGVSVVAVSNCNGASNTAMLAHIWMDPDGYAGDKATWADKTLRVSSAENKRDARLKTAGSGAKTRDNTATALPPAKSCLGSPHATGNPYLFADGHVQTIPYGWNKPKGAQEWVWNWQNTNAINLP